MSTKDAYLTKKSWLQRSGGIMKKGDEIRGKFNARVAVFIERDGEIFAYMSHMDFATPPGEVAFENLRTPEHYMTVAQMRGDEGTPNPTVPSTPQVPPTPQVTPSPETPAGSARSTPASTGLGRDYFAFDVEDLEMDV